MRTAGPVWLLAGGAVVAYLLVGLFKHWNFASNYDLAIFDQAIWHLSRFEVPGSTVSGYANILGDHFYPIVFLFVLPYWVAPYAETLIVAQAMLVAASILPVHAYLARRLPSGQALALSGAYALHWGLQRTIANDVHEMAFAPLIVASALLAYDRRRWGVLWVLSALLVCVKEDLIVLVAAFGVLAWFRGDRRHGAGLVLFGLLAFGLIVGVVIPSFGAWSTGGAYRELLDQPWRLPQLLLRPPQKGMTILFWLLPFCFLPLASPTVLLAVPVALERLLSSVETHWGWGGHYSAPLVPILAMSAGDALRRLQRRLPGLRAPRAARGLVAGSVLLSLVVPGHQPILRLFAPRHYRASPERITAAQALAVIPPSASVVAQSPLLPHLSQRAHLFLLDADAPDADYLIAAFGLNVWPLGSQADVEQLVNDRRRGGYVPVFERSGWVVLQRPPAGVPGR